MGGLGQLYFGLLFSAVLVVTNGRMESACSAMKGRECQCRRPRKMEQKLVCLKENCMKKLPTDDIPDSQISEVVSLLVTRQPNITSIGPEELRRLGNIRDIRIFRCKIREVSPRAFIALNYVERLDLHHNELAEVPTAIKHLRYLKSLNLGGNRITYFSNDAFYSNVRLERLILSRNHLMTLPTLLPQSLLKISVNKNNMTSLGNLNGLIKLEKLYADGNKLTEVPQLPENVTVVSLCSNLIRGKISLGSLPRLKAVNLNYNPEIGHITHSTFSENVSRSNLISFKAKNAGIRSIAMDAFACLPNLQHVEISHNSIQTYHVQWFVGNPALRSVFLAGNPWQCSCDIERSLEDIAYTFSTRRRQREIKRARKGKETKPTDATFTHDFHNVTCLREEFPPCIAFKFDRSSCRIGKLPPHAGELVEATPEIDTSPVTMTHSTTTSATTLQSTTTTPPTTTNTTTKYTTTPMSTTTRETTSRPTTTTSPPTTTTTTTEYTTTPMSTTTRETTGTTTTNPPATSSTTTTSAKTTTTKPPTTTSAITTTTRSTTTSKPTTTTIVIPPLENITAASEPPKEWCLVDGRKCEFPFMYNGVNYNECLAYGIRTWCSATYNFDEDDDWNYCQEC